MTCPLSAEEHPDSGPQKVLVTPEFVVRLLAEAQARNPAIAAADARARAAASGVDSVRTWEDPTATFSLEIPTARGMKASEEGNLIYGVEEKLPLFGRPRLAREAAEAGAIRERLAEDYAVATLRRDLTVALVELALADETVELNRQDIAWLEATLSAVDHRYQVGKASQVEWLKMQTERAKAQNRLKTLALERDHGAREVNRMLNRDTHASWPTVMLPPLQPAVVNGDALAEAALQSEPRLKVMRQEVAQAQAELRVVNRRRQPDIGIGVEGRNYSGDAGLREGLLTVNFSVPWLNSRRYDSDIERDAELVRASEGDAADYALAVREEVHHLSVDLDDARRQALLYRDELIPLAEQAAASASAAWENNTGPLADALDARRMLLENRLMLAQSLAEQSSKLAELCLRVGQSDPSALFLPTEAGSPTP